jgi:hypothetical protein
VGLAADVWGSGRAKDPDTVVARLPRNDLRTTSPLGIYRRLLEGAIYDNFTRFRPKAPPRGFPYSGLERMGADFWPVPVGARGRSATLCGRYPESAWGQLKLDYTVPAALAAGREGAVPSARFLMLRESVQECEARIFIEQTLLDPAKQDRLGEDLIRRAQNLLRDRGRLEREAASDMRAHSPGRVARGATQTWYLGSHARQFDARLYALAAEVAARMAAHEDDQPAGGFHPSTGPVVPAPRHLSE